MLVASKIALSINIFLVLESTSVFSPPITPAIQIGFSESVITISELFNNLSFPSKVIIFSSSLASLTTILFPTLSLSKK